MSLASDTEEEIDYEALITLTAATWLKLGQQFFKVTEA